MSRITQLLFAGFAILAVVVWIAMPTTADQVEVAPSTAKAPGTAAKCPGCKEDTCAGESCPLKVTTVSDTTENPVVSAASSEAELGTPTHHQVKIIKANQEGLSETKLNCFCMTLDGRILAGCGKAKGEGDIRVFSSEGDYVETWSSPVKVEAINVRASDGHVFVAGDGRLVQLDDSGNLVADEPSPHASVSKEQAGKMREAVIKQMKSRVELYKQQAKVYDKQIDLIGTQLDKLQAKLDELSVDDDDEPGDVDEDDDADDGDEDADDDDDDDEDDAVAARTRQMLEQQIAQLERGKSSLERTRTMWNQQIEKLGDAEPSEEDIQRQIESQIARKLAVASISAVDDQVFVACSATVGYGYCVWSISDDFASGEEIIGDLRGCCGQMDVQVNDRGIYVAENARDRVVCYDLEGEEITHWGHSARQGIRGFGSCCNPMNVAFGPDHTVYTAESGTGRIKQYTAEGELLQVVGSADLVPGCKKVSIGVSSDGNRVFMLDITRNHIVMMDRIPAAERQEMVAKAQAAEDAANAEKEQEEQAEPDADSSVQADQAATLRVLAVPAVKVQPAVRVVPAQ